MKLSDVKEFARVMVLSILVMVRRIREMVMEFLEGVRAFAGRIVQAIREMVSTVLWNIEQFFRAVADILLTFARRIGAFFRAQGRKIMEVLQRFHAVLRHFYYTVIIPPIHRIRGYLRHVYLMIRLAWGRSVDSVRTLLRRAHSAFMKVWRQFVAAVHRGLVRIWTVVVAFFTRVHDFFRSIAQAFIRICKWMIRSFKAFWERTVKAFERCDSRFIIFFFIAMGLYWYIFINTHHRITALIISTLLLYPITFVTVIYPILASVSASVVVWINKYHPILALVKRCGVAFERVWFSFVFITTALLISLARTIQTSIIRVMFAIHAIALAIMNELVRLLTPPLVFMYSIILSLHERLVNAVTAIIWTTYLILRHAALAIRRAGIAVYGFIMLVAIGIAVVMRKIGLFGKNVLLTIGHAIASAARAVGHAITVAAKAVGQAIAMAARAIGHAILIVGGWIALALFAVYEGIVRVVRAAHFALVTVYSAIVRVVTRVYGVIRDVYLAIARTVMAIYRAIAHAIDIVVTIVVSTMVAIVTAIHRGFVLIATFVYTMIMTVIVNPIVRSGVAFRRTALTIVVTMALIATLMATGILEVLVKMTLPVFAFFIRNMMAWHRVLFTTYFFTVKLGTAIVTFVTSAWNAIVASFLAATRWLMLMVRTHYRGIRDISLIFSPSMVTGVLYLALGGTLLLVFAVSWTVGITSLSYLYNRKKGAELNV